MSLVPCWQPLEKSQSVLGGPVLRHLVFVLASLLGEGADTLVDPLVAIDLGLFTGRRLAYDVINVALQEDSR